MGTAYLRSAEGSAFDPDTGRLLRLGPVTIVPTPTWMRWRPDELYEALRAPSLARAHLDTMLGWTVEADAGAHADVIRERIRELDEAPFYAAPDRRLARPAHPPDTHTRWTFGPPLEERIAEAVEVVRAQQAERRANGETAPWLNTLCPLYAYALDGLEGRARFGTHVRFTGVEAAGALRTAHARLARPDAPPYGPQPDAGDVRAFLQALLDDEVVHTDGAGGYVIVAEHLPF